MTDIIPEFTAAVVAAINDAMPYAANIGAFSNTFQEGLPEYHDWIRDLNKPHSQQVIWQQPSSFGREYEGSPMAIALDAIRKQHVATAVLQALIAAGWRPPLEMPPVKRAGHDFPCALHRGPAGDCTEQNCRCV